MKQLKKKISPWKIGSMMAAIAITVFIFSCEDKLGSGVEEVIEEEQPGMVYSEGIINKMKELQDEDPETTYRVVQLIGEEPIPGTMEAAKNSVYVEREQIDDSNIRLTFIVKEIKTLYYDQEGGLKDISEDEVFSVVDKVPEYPGGLDQFYNYVRENLKYPKQASEAGIEGKVFVQFIVNKSGEIEDAVVVKGIGAGCDEMALGVVKNSPKWTPGVEKGEAVKVRMIIPITFQLSK